jgi:8-oxo-dGTP diphosphatase
MTTPAIRAHTEPTFVDRGFQVAYVCAYRGMRMYWKLRHPATHGTHVALWNRGEVLLVRNSYVPYYVFPGGYVRRGETARQAAQRELLEEVGVAVTPDELKLVLDEKHEWEGKREHTEIYALEVAERPRVQVDHREVVDASWWPPERALSLDLFPPVRHALERAKAGA